MALQSTTAVRVSRLPTATVSRDAYESTRAARDTYRDLYLRQTLALHRRSVELLAANDEIHRLRQLLVAHGIDPESAQ